MLHVIAIWLEIEIFRLIFEYVSDFIVVVYIRRLIYSFLSALHDLELSDDNYLACSLVGRLDSYHKDCKCLFLPISIRLCLHKGISI